MKYPRTFVVITTATLLIVALVRGRHEKPAMAAPPLGTPGGPSTSQADLERTVTAMKARLAKDPSDTAAAVSLADALLRQTRVVADPALAVTAEQTLRRALSAHAGDYDAQRMLATTLLSQHRFREAVTAATIARDARPNDAWNYGVIGDAHLELGEYDEAFDAFDRMIQLRPSAAAYARASYARELQGDLKAAVRFMQMAREATPPTDPESQAWHDVQLAHLDMELDRLDDADHHLDRAMFVFANYVPATEMRVRLLTMQRRFEEAAQMASVQLARVPTPALAVQAGDAMSALGRTADADRYYRQAEELWRYEPAALARFLADSGRDVTRAVKLAEGASATRRDIFTQDALAWSLFKAGEIKKADVVLQQALRTGTRDRAIRAHAAEIQRALHARS